MLNRVALVTGGSRGIGAAICRKLAADGYTVVVNYKSSKAEAEKLAGAIKGVAIQADMADDKQILKLVAAVKKRYGKLDVLVNNAGIAVCDDIQSAQKSDFMATLTINLWAPFYLIQQCLPLFAKSASIVNLSSICASRATPDALAYAAAKAGLESLVQGLAKPLAPQVRINAVAPWATLTDMMRQNYGGEKEGVKWVKANCPLQQISQPEDIAEMVGFLCSEKARNITGQVFTVDGGRSVV